MTGIPVSLSLTAATPSQYDVHLFGGSSLNEGRVEIYYNGEWGTVCDDSWDLNDATVVCRQLGYANAVRAATNAEFGQGTGRIWRDNVGCSGTESMLSNCFASYWGSHNCQHSEDAGVVCGTRKCPASCIKQVSAWSMECSRCKYTIPSAHATYTHVTLGRQGVIFHCGAIQVCVTGLLVLHS